MLIRIIKHGMLLLIIIIILISCGNDGKNENYKSVKIGTQFWMVENLNVITFRNGDTIMEARSSEEWIDASKENKPAWCYCNNDSLNAKKYGKLYNWYAVSDPRGLAPKGGWYIPSIADCKILVNYSLEHEISEFGNFSGGGRQVDESWVKRGFGTKTTGTQPFQGAVREDVLDNSECTDGSIFIWTATEMGGSNAYFVTISKEGHTGGGNDKKRSGYSIRCIKNY